MVGSVPARTRLPPPPKFAPAACEEAPQPRRAPGFCYRAGAAAPSQMLAALALGTPQAAQVPEQQEQLDASQVTHVAAAVHQARLRGG